MIEPAHPYLTDQLIPYIGNKRKLLPLIRQAIEMTGLTPDQAAPAHSAPARAGSVIQDARAGFVIQDARAGSVIQDARAGFVIQDARAGFVIPPVTPVTFFDPFAGSGVVSRLAKTMGFRVIANDWEPYAEAINTAYIATNAAPPFDKLGGLESAITALNALTGEPGYIASHYCPADDEAYDTVTERMFYTQINGRRIDAIREQIQAWRNSGTIDAREESLLLASLIYQASYCSNTSGVFKGFHNGWGGATRTAWYRIRSLLTLRAPVLFDNGFENVVFREDASKLASEIECDIAYLDPPYNQHQYGSNYHMLNTVALWDKPAISPTISGNGHRDKAAIREDWRTLRRSHYCYKSTALSAFSKLVERLRARYILVSYSTDGIIGVEDLLESLSRRGALAVVRRQYKRYRVSSQRPSPRPHTVEFVAIVDTSQAAGQYAVERAVREIVG